MKTRKLLCMILVVAAISCFSSMLSFAFSATSSNALMATSSNAWPMDDFVELDDFDSIDRPVLMNAGELDGFESTVPASFLSLGVGYSNMSGVVKYVQVPFDSKNNHHYIQRLYYLKNELLYDTSQKMVIQT